ncbi:MAG: 30S ribosomal protein S5 [Candidatus Zambryskibacteria bacterium CG_4_9_14_3_um_filter_40_16]|uniref:Small ribosomal subunit protein uS5 n=2 Tax=Candidatus Zambryskiibacteriota TaxID=1817925 RepID=A0A2H0K693_9BACT|nr:MAG: 30S ribosomal protein S5 [Candidatus Zambryskibacteria bacterium CG11_big_fil_rev_8_21_14_0_20_40_24]PJA33729.1 MAG: 30S ribosomal protein S5 [Candidatus Zambryskibacteria bacterium CG_4_9_14_3_um_filter_40_16]
MSEKEIEKKEEVEKKADVADGGSSKDDSRAPNERLAKKDYKKNPRRSSRKESRPRSEFDNKIVSIRRVTRVAAGGRRFTFSVTLVAGNRKGKVGIGQGKAGDTPLAIEKALREAKKNMIDVKVTKNMSIPHDSLAKFGGSKVIIIPAPGRGLLAGSSVRTVLEMAGLTSVNAKILSTSKNPVNNAKAALKALSQLSKTVTPRFK